MFLRRNNTRNFECILESELGNGPCAGDLKVVELSLVVDGVLAGVLLLELEGSIGRDSAVDDKRADVVLAAAGDMLALDLE